MLKIPLPGVGLDLATLLRREAGRFRKATHRERKMLLQRYLKRLVQLFLLPLLFLLAGLLRAALYALFPFVHIRFGWLWAFSLGQFALPMESYLCQRDLGFLPKRCFDLFYHYDREGDFLQPEARGSALICNVQLDRMFCQQIKVWEGARFLGRLNRTLPGSGLFSVELPQADDPSFLDGCPQHLFFTPKEEEEGARRLEALGVPPGSPFVLFHVRDGQWLYRARPRVSSLYGDWPAFGDFKNASLENFIPAVQLLAQRGYSLIRLGKYVKEPLPALHPRVIDYAWKHQSDFMDVYLAAHCRFFLGQNSGATNLAMIFRKPLALTNICQIETLRYSCGRSTVSILKKFYSEKKGGILSLKEIIEHGLSAYHPKWPQIRAIAQSLQLELLENTPEEIAQLALEMHERLLGGAFQSTPEDDTLQERFMAVVRSYPREIPMPPGRRITLGRDFLRSHPELIRSERYAERDRPELLEAVK